MQKLEKMLRDRSGLLLILAGAALIFGNVCSSRAPSAADGQAGAVCSRAGQMKQEGHITDLRIVGSSSMEKYADALAEGFMERYPGVTVTFQFTGSSAGIAAVTGGSADVGLSSRYLTEVEKAAGASENIVGFDGIAICANPANGISGLTGEQLSRLYTGQIAYWSELGGNDLPVVLIGREAGSGTRVAFEGLLGLAEQCTYANELDSTGAVMARIEATPGAIGYVSLEAAEGILSLDGVSPSLENIRRGSYPLYRPFIMVTGEGQKGNELLNAWFAYVYSEEGSRIAEKMKIVMKPYSSGSLLGPLPTRLMSGAAARVGQRGDGGRKQGRRGICRINAGSPAKKCQ